MDCKSCKVYINHSPWHRFECTCICQLIVKETEELGENHPAQTVLKTPHIHVRPGIVSNLGHRGVGQTCYCSDNCAYIYQMKDGVKWWTKSLWSSSCYRKYKEEFMLHFLFKNWILAAKYLLMARLLENCDELLVISFSLLLSLFILF